MPNHCLNLVRISGPDRERALAAMRSAENPFDFQRLRPCPKELFDAAAPFAARPGESKAAAKKRQRRLVKEYGADDWYRWCLMNWGTKWNSYRHFKVAGFDAAFFTAWGAPEVIYCALTARYDILLTLVDHDEGGAFSTQAEYRQGQCVFCRDLTLEEEQRAEQLWLQGWQEEAAAEES